MTAEELYMTNEKLVYYVLYRFFPRRLAEDEDMQQTARLALWRACLHYDETAGVKFATYAVTAIRRAILRELEMQNCPTKKAELISLYTKVRMRKRGNEESNVELIDILPGDLDVDWRDLNGAMSCLTDEGKYIVSLCIDGYTKSEIARMLGVSPQAVRGRLLHLKDKFTAYI